MRFIGLDDDDIDRITQPLQLHLSLRAKADTLNLGRKMNDLGRGEHLARRGLPTEASGHVERRSTEPTAHRNRFASINADTHRNVRIVAGVASESFLQRNRCADGLTCRRKDDQGLVTTQFEEQAVERGYDVFDRRSKGCCQQRSGLVATLLGVRGVSPNVGDQERVDAALGLTWARCRCTGRAAGTRCRVIRGHPVIVLRSIAAG